MSAGRHAPAAKREASVPTFREAVITPFEANRPHWCNIKTRSRWRSRRHKCPGPWRPSSSPSSSRCCSTCPAWAKASRRGPCRSRRSSAATARALHDRRSDAHHARQGPERGPLGGFLQLPTSQRSFRGKIPYQASARVPLAYKFIARRGRTDHRMAQTPPLAMRTPKPRSPKLTATQRTDGNRLWYPYYAGFSQEFVQDCLSSRQFPYGESQVLDPWNGSGTTTAACHRYGMSAVGYDLNPAMVIVAKARLLSSEVASSLKPLADELLVDLHAVEVTESEPLSQWFDPQSAALVRCLEQRIQLVLVGAEDDATVMPRQTSAVSSLAAFYYLALFRSVRHLVRPFLSSNPTWLRVSKAPEDRLSLSSRVLHRRFSTEVATMRTGLTQRPQQGAKDTRVTIAEGDARRLPLPVDSIDLIVSSPPYLTRIDYAVATRPELAILGYEAGEGMARLRQQLTGGVRIRNTTPTASKDWGEVCTGLLAAVEAHPSKASSGYYLKQFLQYFSDIFDSLGEIQRVLTSGGRSILVVQDSLYKDLHVNLPSVVLQMGEAKGLKCFRTHRYPVRRSFRHLNTRAKKHRTDWMPTEAAIEFGAT